MKLILISCLFVALAASVSIPLENFQLDLEREWASFKEKFARNFANFNEESERKAIFANNLKEMKLQNYKYALGLTSFTMDINRLADMTGDEISKQLCGYKEDPNSQKSGVEFKRSPNAQLPASLDWRQSGYVTPVKDQGSCGSCWAFSSTGALEGQEFKKSGKLAGLSEQNLVDCSWKYGNMGCGGGWMHQAFDYIRENGGINTGDIYPYEARNARCRYIDDKASIGSAVSTHVFIEKYSEADLQEAVATQGPVAVAIDASRSSFHYYKTGVMDDPLCSQTRLSHAVLVVGYGTENNKDYWLVKNSWGTSWGDQGYIKMSRNKNNQCGIASAAVFPVV